MLSPARQIGHSGRHLVGCRHGVPMTCVSAVRCLAAIAKRRRTPDSRVREVSVSQIGVSCTRQREGGQDALYAPAGWITYSEWHSLLTEFMEEVCWAVARCGWSQWGWPGGRGARSPDFIRTPALESISIALPAVGLVIESSRVRKDMVMEDNEFDAL